MAYDWHVIPPVEREHPKKGNMSAVSHGELPGTINGLEYSRCSINMEMNKE